MTIKLKAMTKQKKYFFALLIFSCAIYNTAKAQLYSIESFDGTNAKISLNYTLFSKTLKVSCLNDTLFLSDYTGTREVHVLNKRFLQIVYGVRGGSGLDLRSTLILSVSKGKINVAVLVTSYAGLVSADKNGLYWLKFNMAGNSSSTYKLTVNVHDQQTSKLHPEGSHNKNEQVTLSFDADRNIFYTSCKDINKSSTINEAKTGQSEKQQIKGMLPVIELGQNSYYYIKDKWYRSGYDDNLFSEYYR